MNRKPGEKYRDKELIEAVTLLKKFEGNQTAAAKSLGLPRATFQSRIREAETRGFIEKQSRYTSNTVGEVEMPELPSSELPAKDLIKQAADRFIQHKAAKDARRWMPIKVKNNKPIGVCFMGDPHIDSSGCNWPLLHRDITLLEKTEGMYCVNIGDLTDNWVGRLQRLYANSEMTKKQAWKLAAYILRDCDIKWLCILLGNHDLWGDGEYIIKANTSPIVPVEEWQSRFKIVFPNGREIKIHAAHDFPGTSMWNIQHGPQKAAMMMEDADIYACGHKHQWAVTEGENSHRSFLYWLVRCRGYKAIDSYAEVNGYGHQQFGASITAVIDPTVDGPRRIRCFPDLEEAADFLEYKRKRYDSGRGS